MITVNEILKTYSKKPVLDIPKLEIKEAEIIGLVGNNGAGKTTFFRLLLDLIRADRGTITSMDKNVATSEEWKAYTSAYLDEGFLITHLTPKEYFYFCGKLHNLSTVDVDEFIVKLGVFFEDDILKSKKYIRDFSKGNQFKIGIASCLLQQPQVLILDEPFANLDPTSQLKIIQLLKDLNQQKGMTILISSHDLTHITDVCTRILLLEKGKIIKDLKTEEGTLTELSEYFKV